MNTPFPSTVYGPVLSWREGMSLGIDPIRDASTCSFNCIYCQLGAIQNRTAQRRIFVPTETILADFQKSAWRESQILCFSGSGEPTLALNLGEIAQAIAEIAPQPRLVLTNGTTLGNIEVIEDLIQMERIYVKIDSLTEETFQRINRPLNGISLHTIIRDIRAFRAKYDGCLAIQVMLLPNNIGEIHRLVEIVNDLSPDEIQLNTPTRPYPKSWHVTARGGHSPEQRLYEATPMRTIEPNEVIRLQRVLRDATAVPVRSAYEQK